MSTVAGQQNIKEEQTSANMIDDPNKDVCGKLNDIIKEMEDSKGEGYSISPLLHWVQKAKTQG